MRTNEPGHISSYRLASIANLSLLYKELGLSFFTKNSIKRRKLLEIMDIYTDKRTNIYILQIKFINTPIFWDISYFSWPILKKPFPPTLELKNKFITYETDFEIVNEE